MSFADSWYRASCALLLLTLHFSMFSFYLPLSFSLSLSLLLSLSLSLSLSFSLSLSLYLCPLFLSVVARHMSSDALYQIFSSWSILLFHTISFHSSYKIHQLFTDYLLRLSSSELLEKHLFRSRANRRLVPMIWGPGGSKSRLAKAAGAETSGEMRDEKLHAVVAPSRFRSEQIQNTSAPDHFWKLRCWKSARRCGAKHIWK